MNNELTIESLFPTCISYINKPEFLLSSKIVFDEYALTSKTGTEINPLYPVVMTNNMFNDIRLTELVNYILNTAWNFLQFQGYNMESFYTQFMDFWGQEHYLGSGMDYHVHGSGAQISGFYFIEVPENSNLIVFHDPRPTKVYADLIQKDYSKPTYATNTVNYKPKAGDLYFHNSWLPHSLSKNGNDNPMKFFHFNIATVPKHFFNAQLTEEKKPIVV